MPAMSNKQQSLWQQGQRYTQQRRWRQAADAYEAIVDHDPRFLPAWMELSTALEHLDAYRGSHHAVMQAARIDQVPPMAGLAVARRLRRLEALPELQRYVERIGLAARLPADKLIDLVAFFSSAGDHRRTLAWIDHAIALRPDFADAHNMRGLALMFAGRNTESAAAFERALQLRPDFHSVYSVLARVDRIDAGHNHVDTLRRLLAQRGLDARDEGHLAYALHYELHDLGEYDDAWQALERGCRARRQVQTHDHAQAMAVFDRLRRTFDAAFSRGEPVEDPLTPVFIVGLHRSGTSLLERILSGHPDVADAGETYSFSAQMRHAADHFAPGIADQTIADRAAGLDYRAVGRGFLDAMRVHSEGRGFVTEKMNPNFILLGPIAKALPQARLLHMRRDPADTCFSNLRTLFTREASYSYDQLEMADYYKAYHDLMAHWREALGERVFDVDYDAMVAEPEAQTRRIAAHCGFGFQADMLRVERSSGTVATASSHQVRQGILRNRGGAWKAYARHVEPMLERLASHGLA